MATLYLILALLALLAGAICYIWIVVEAFRDEPWKGFLGFLCGFYLLYFALAEWDHDQKWPIIMGAFFGNIIAAGLLRMAGPISG